MARDERELDRAMVEWRLTWQWSLLPALIRWVAYFFRTAAVGFVALALWRFGNDLGATQAFFIEEGVWSHWQPWVALAIGFAFMPGLLKRVFPEPSVAQMLPGAHELFDSVQPMPPSIPPTIESPCSVEVRRAMGY
jgi:hypothetical protein